MRSYRIADININVLDDNAYIVNRMKIYEKNFDNDCDVSISVKHFDSIHLPLNNLIIKESKILNWVQKPNSEEGFYGYKTLPQNDEVADLLDTDIQWKNATISYLDADYYKDREIDPIHAVAFDLIGIMLRNRILFHEGIVIHASSIVHEGKGIIFTAPSGTGKSTHVRLWEEYKKAEVLNDDTPPIRLIEGKPIVYGSPWSGSSDKYLNKKAPLAAIFILEQAPSNSVETLSKQEIIARLMPRLFLPYFSNDLMERAISNFENLIPEVPVYLLKCRPDKEAMEMAYQCVK